MALHTADRYPAVFQLLHEPPFGLSNFHSFDTYQSATALKGGSVCVKGQNSGIFKNDRARWGGSHQNSEWGR